MIKTADSSSTASLAFQSIATVAGIATIHAFVSGGMFGKPTKPKEGKTDKGFDVEDSKEEEREEDSDL